MRIRLPSPLQPGASQTIGISYYVLDAYKPLPAAIKQEDVQFLSYSFSAYCPSAYTTTKQKTEVKFPTSTIPDYTKLPGTGDVKQFPQKQGSKLIYGPFDEKPAGAAEHVQVRFEFNKPVIHVSRLERDIEVSHWGGNVAFEERYDLEHRGANLSSQFNRVKYAQSRYYNPISHALQEMKFPLRVGSVDPYYTDVIGNVSTSRFRSNKREALLEIKPRYPIFGGWKYPFTIGWNADAKNFLRKTAGGSFVLNVPILEGPKQAEGVEYETAVIRVILPEGAEYVKHSPPYLSSYLANIRTDIGTSSSTPTFRRSRLPRPRLASTRRSWTPLVGQLLSSRATTWWMTIGIVSLSLHTTCRCPQSYASPWWFSAVQWFCLPASGCWARLGCKITETLDMSTV